MLLSVRLLGIVTVERDGAPVSITAAMQRAVLVALVLARDHAVTVDQLVDSLWFDPPDGSVNVVQQYVSALRRKLGSTAVVTVPGGYQLTPDADVDVDRFRQLARQGEALRRSGSPAAAGRTMREALDLWHGPAAVDLPDCPLREHAATRFEQEHRAAQLCWLAVQNDLGAGASIILEAEALAEQQPLDERAATELMRALAEAGRQVDALGVYDRMRDRLADELGVSPGPILEQAQVAILRQDPTVVVSSTATSLGQLPRPRTRIVGREQDVHAVQQLLAAGGPLTTVTGPGGVGKTRLVIDVAGRVTGRQVVFVQLAAVTAVDLVVPTLATALGIKLSRGADAVSLVASALDTRDALVVVDNFEHVVAAAGELADVLAASSGSSQLLVTSREPLRIRGEQVWALTPLATLNGAGETAPAVELFWITAEAVGARFDRNAEAEAVAAICRRLDGLPLAIELAASRSGLLTPSKMLDRLSRRMSLLTDGARDAPERQQSLRACLAWSVDLLGDAERRALAALSVFAGGATLEAAEEVLGGVLGEVDALEVLDHLIAKSLIRGGSRLTMLETIREYAAELLDGEADRAAVEQAHAVHFHSTYGRGANLLAWPPRTAVEARGWYDDLPNLRVALETLHRTARYEEYADLVVALGALWRTRGLWPERITHLERLLSLPGVSRLRRADALIGLASYNGLARAETEALLAEAVHLLAPDAATEPIRVCYVHESRAFDAYSAGDVDLARELMRTATDAASRSGDRELAAEAEMYTSMFSEEANRDFTGMAHALDVARRHANQFLERGILINLSEQALGATDPDILRQGIIWGRDAYRLATLVDDAASAALGLSNAATAALLCGEPPGECAQDLRTALRAVHQAGDVVNQIEDLLRLGAAERALGNRNLGSKLYTLWGRFTRNYDLGTTPSNQRVIDRFLSDIEPSREEELHSMPLVDAVNLALGSPSLGRSAANGPLARVSRGQ